MNINASAYPTPMIAPSVEQLEYMPQHHAVSHSLPATLSAHETSCASQLLALSNSMAELDPKQRHSFLSVVLNREDPNGGFREIPPHYDQAGTFNRAEKIRELALPGVCPDTIGDAVDGLVELSSAPSSQLLHIEPVEEIDDSVDEDDHIEVMSQDSCLSDEDFLPKPPPHKRPRTTKTPTSTSSSCESDVDYSCTGPKIRKSFKASSRGTDSPMSVGKRTHEPKVKCPFDNCGKYLSQSHMKLHISSIHSEQKPEFPCDVCGAVFRYRWNMIAHRKAHVEPTYVPCIVPGCSKTFTLKGNMTKHVQKHHKHEGSIARGLWLPKAA